MRVKKLISFYENQHYFTILFIHNFLSRWLNESFRFFGVSHVKIQEKWFILVHFTKSLFLLFFVAYRAARILALASSTLLYMSFAVALSVHQELSEHLKLSRRTLQEYRKPIIDGKIRDDR